MAASIFDFVADEIEKRTELAKLEARGTVRLALKEGGLDARTVTGEQMAVILTKVMPGEMRSRGVENADEVCEGMVTTLKAQHPTGAPESGDESPEAIFRRLAAS
jgi:hypothetical protein